MKKDYVVSLNVSFSTPLDAKANSKKEAENKCKAQCQLPPPKSVILKVACVVTRNARVD